MLDPYSSNNNTDQNSNYGSQMPPFLPDYSSSMLPSQRDDVKFIEQINPEQILLKLKHILQRKEYDIEHNKWVNIIGPDGKLLPPIVNELGRSNLMISSYSRVTTNTTLSGIGSQDDIAALMRLAGKNLIVELMLNYKKYGIEKAHLDTVLFSILDAYYFALRRAYAERQFINKTLRAGENVNTNPNQSENTRTGFWSKFLK